jgi:epoxyqueuosine reductase
MPNEKLATGPSTVFDALLNTGPRGRNHKMPEIMNESTQNWSHRLQAEIEKAVAVFKDQQECDNIWRRPLLGIAGASDSLFERVRIAVGPDHALPSELLPKARSVIVYFLPFAEFLGKENSEHGPYAARSWATSYVLTNQLIGVINTHLQDSLDEAGFASQGTQATHNFDEEQLISRWSHKHLAFIAGVGTFGHHHLLITPAGCCGRLGSLVTELELEPTPRPAAEWCLAKSGSICHACVGKCRYGALHITHFDRHACYRQLLRNDSHHSDLPLVDVCGKCACEVPCSYAIPEGRFAAGIYHEEREGHEG